MFLKEFWVFFLAAALFSIPIVPAINCFLAKGILTCMTVRPQEPFETEAMYTEVPFTKVVSVLYPVALILLFLVCTTYLVKGSYNPFVYFQF